MLKGFVVATCLTLGACVTEMKSRSEAADLAGSHWQLILRDATDQRNTARANGSEAYAISLLADGMFEMKLGCNHAIGRWSAMPLDIMHGSIKFRGLAIKPSPCPLTNFDAKIARETIRAKSYIIDGEGMQLRTDRESYTWKRLPL
jgi:hypothetical protein